MDKGRPADADLIRLLDVPNIVLELTGVLRKVDTIRKWATQGVRGYDGTRLRLQTCKRLRSIFTTRVWIENFLRSM